MSKKIQSEIKRIALVLKGGVSPDQKKMKKKVCKGEGEEKLEGEMRASSSLFPWGTRGFLWMEMTKIITCPVPSEGGFTERRGGNISITEHAVQRTGNQKIRNGYRRGTQKKEPPSQKSKKKGGSLSKRLKDGQQSSSPARRSSTREP